MPQLAQLDEVPPNQITTWKTQLAEGAAAVFGGAPAVHSPVPLKLLHDKIEELTLRNDFLSDALVEAGLLSATR